MKETRTVRVRIELPNPDLALLPDMYGDVEIATGADRRRRGGTLWLPSSTAAAGRSCCSTKATVAIEPRDVKAWA